MASTLGIYYNVYILLGVFVGLNGNKSNQNQNQNECEKRLFFNGNNIAANDALNIMGCAAPSTTIWTLTSGH